MAVLEDSEFDFNVSLNRKNTPIPDVKLIDMNNDKLFYGRVDEKQNAIYLSSMDLTKQLKSKKQLFALNFVADAYEAFKFQFTKAKSFRRMATDTVISPNATKAWVNLDVEQDDYLKEVFSTTFMFYIKERKNMQTHNVVDFVNHFKSYVSDFASNIMITKSGYLKSSFCFLRVSGLAIELSDKSYNDNIFRNQWLGDDNFSFYKTVAAQNGFYIDKNVPWRLVADVSSPEMQSFMSRYGIPESPGTASDLFERYYTKSYLTDIPDLKDLLLRTYNTFVEIFPVATLTKINGCGKIVKQEITRVPTTEEEFEKSFTNKFWLETYLQLRLKEENVNLAQTRFNYILRYAESLEKRLDFNKAISYINSQVQKSASTKADLRFCQNYSECGD